MNSGLSNGQFQFGPCDRMIDGQEVHRADHAVGLHRIDDVLRVGPRARVVIDLGADRIAHPAPQPFRDDRGVADLDAGGFGRAVEIAGLREFECPAHEIDRGRILEREVVHVVGDHHEARPAAAACVVEPKKQHPRRQRDRTLVAKRLVFALSVPVDIWYRVYARIVFDVIVQVSYSAEIPQRAGTHSRLGRAVAWTSAGTAENRRGQKADANEPDGEAVSLAGRSLTARQEDALRHDLTLLASSPQKPLAAWKSLEGKKKPATAAGGQDSGFLFIGCAD